MGAPQINISFIEKARSIFKRADRGIVGLVLKDNVPSPDKKEFTVQFIDDIPEYLSDFNKEQIKLALLGNVTSPKKVVCYVMNNTGSGANNDDEDEPTNTLTEMYKEARAWIRKTKIHFLAMPTVATDGMLSDMVMFVKEEINVNKNKIMAVFPFTNTEDSEGIIGCDFTAYTTEDTHTAASGTYTAEEYCSRIAGYIAGTPFTQSITYGTLNDLSDCNRLTIAEQDAAVDGGKLVLMHDGEKVKIVRGVNTFKTTTKTKGDSFKKIKIVNIMNLIYDDLMKSIRDDYIGKFNNDYDDKCILITAINSYFMNLVTQSIIVRGEAQIDIEAQRNHLRMKGEDVTEMSDKEILEGDTGSIVYLTGNVFIPDAIEDIEFPIYL